MSVRRPLRDWKAGRRAVALALIGAFGGCASAAPPSAHAIEALPFAPSRSNDVAKYVKHVVVIIQENRSFENFFAGYPGADAPMYGFSEGPNHQRVKIPLRKSDFEHGSDFSHLWQAAIADWHGGAMDGFQKYGAYVYVDRMEVLPYWTMAKRYVLADHMFPTEFGPSWTSHLNLIAGTDNLKRTVAVADFASGPYNSCDSPPTSRTTTIDARRHLHYHGGPYPCFSQFNTMAQDLDAAGVSWKYYVTRARHGGIWSPFGAIKYVRLGEDWKTDIVAPQNRILTDVQNGDLASVSWVTPTRLDSDHQGNHSDTGPSWVTSIVNAIGKSPYWKSTAIVVLWDEWGGLYDNVPPPQLDFRGLGIRVPCLILSPYAKEGFVSHTRYEYGSILKFVEQAFRLPRLGPAEEGYTDSRAQSIEDSFDFTQKPRPFKAIRSKYPMEHFLNEPASDDPVDDD